MPKVVITTVPFVDEDSPLAAPAVLKASLLQHGIDCVGLDLNIEIYNKLKHDLRKPLFLNFFFKQEIHEEIADDLVSMLRFFCVEILSHKPDIIGLSLFCSDCQVFAAWLCAMLRQQAPDKKIIIGGPGLETLSQSLFKYPERLKQLGLIDDFITGDAEQAIVNYVKNVNNKRVNSLEWSPDTDLNQSCIPDFSDYRFFRYGNALLPIVDSRGCVQDCEFCDVIAFWKKFQYLNAENIFNQMMSHIEQHSIYRFQFSSSICNGNLKEFRKLMKLLSQYNQKTIPEEQIHWTGSFIIRPAQYHSEELWQMIKLSNGFLLTGVESIVEHVRIALGKKFSNFDLEHHLEMGRRYQVPMNLLIIAAYYTETAEDHEYVKQWFLDHSDFANNTVMQIQLTLPSILPGTRLASTVDIEDFKSKSKLRFEKGRELHNIIQTCGFVTKHFFSV